jgi:hypothetical protein
MEELPQATGSYKPHILSIASSGCLQDRRHAQRCCYFKFNVGGAISFFASAEAAGKDKLTAVMDAGTRHQLGNIERHNENIARAKKAKRPTAKPKTDAGSDRIKINEKTWMMRLQQYSIHRLYSYQAALKNAPGICLQAQSAIFAGPLAV